MSRESVTSQKVHDSGGVLNRRRIVTRKEKRGKDFMAVVNERQCMEEKEHKLGKMTAAEPARCYLQSFARKTVIENKKRGGTGSITV